tara:strand:- start:7942 stop:8121 length:180 start_codon:yes stop_codon:yes gene_type:complete
MTEDGCAYVSRSFAMVFRWLMFPNIDARPLLREWASAITWRLSDNRNRDWHEISRPITL